MKWPVVALLFSGIVAAFCAALLVGLLGIGRGVSPQAQSGQPRDIKYLVLKGDVKALTVISEDMIEQKDGKSDKVPAGALGDPKLVISDVVTTDLKAGTVLTATHFATDHKGKKTAALLTRGKRLMTVALSNFQSLEGLLYPGAVVDVIASFRLQGTGEARAVSTTLLQSVEVWDVEGDTIRPEDVDRSDPNPIKTAVNKVEDKEAKDKKAVAAANPQGRIRKVTLVVDPAQAAALQLAVDYGQITLAIRKPGDLDQVSTEDTATVLNEGKLAKLAEYLKTTVGGNSGNSGNGAEGDKPATPKPQTHETSVFSSPQPANTNSSDWEVAVFRGVKVDRVSVPVASKSAQ